MPADDAAEVGRAGDERRNGEREHERRLDEHRQRQVAARSLQREAVGGVPGRSADGEPGEREQPGQRESVVADAEARRGRRGRNEEHGGAHRGRDEHGGEQVDERRALDVDAALAPQAAELAVRLERARPAPALEPRLGLLGEPDQQRGEGDAADDLDGTADELTGPSSDRPDPDREEQRDDEADQVRDVGSEPAALQPPRPCGREERAVVTGR